MPIQSRFNTRWVKKTHSSGIIDLLDEKAILYRDETLGAEFRSKRFQLNIGKLFIEYREKIIEAACEADEALFEKFVGGETDFQ